MNLPQAMTQNSAAAGGNPIQNITTMNGPMNMNMNSHNGMMSSTAAMVKFCFYFYIVGISKDCNEKNVSLSS